MEGSPKGEEEEDDDDDVSGHFASYAMQQVLTLAPTLLLLHIKNFEVFLVLRSSDYIRSFSCSPILRFIRNVHIVFPFV